VLILVSIPVLLIGAPYFYIHYVDAHAPAPLALPASSGGDAGPIGGTWVLGPPSQAQYRVPEILLGLHHIAVGSTEKLSGKMVISGTTVTYVKVSVDMASVTSDQTGRNVAFRDFILDTGTYRYGYFTLTRPIQLGTVPPGGQQVTVQAVGNLELRGVTRPVTFPLHAERLGSQIVVSGSLTITFSQWHIPNPSFGVAQVGSQGTIGVLLYFHRPA